MTASVANDVVFSQTTISGAGSDLGYTNPLTVTIGTTGDEENLTKSIFLIPAPKSTAKQETDTTSDNYGPADTKIVDILNKVEQRITVDGFLTTGLGANDSSYQAEDKKEDLKKIFLGGRVFNMKYEGQVITVNADKMSIRREKFDGLQGTSGEVVFSVKITLIRGVNLA